MTNSFTINGINSYYKGNIKKGAVVFIHGSSLNACIFKKQFEQIASFPMLAIDLPGHGLSDKARSGENTYNLPGYALAVSEVINELELEDFILLGHSAGGNIALEAIELLPGLRGLFLLNTCPFILPPQFDNMCRQSPFLGYFLSGNLQWNDALSVAGEMVQDDEALAQDLAEWIMQADGATRLAFAASLGLDKFNDEFLILERFDKPLAIAMGKHDRFINPAYLKALKTVSLWQNSIIELESGHIPQLESPERFNELINDFYTHVLYENR